MKKIVLFNHKGGVSKTTSAFHIGWKLAESGERVLLVDADPQCNLTAYFLRDDFDKYYLEESTKKQNLKDGVEVAFSGAPTQIQPVEPVSCSRNNNLFLLPGHMNLSEYDANLSFAFTTSQTINTLQNLPGSFNQLIELTGNKIDATYVIIDLNPGLSTINEDLFLISDAFIIPTNPDTFSIMALKSLAKILPRWVKWKNNNIELYSESAYPLPAGIPKFIGELPQRFNIRGGNPTTPFKVKLEDLAHTTTNELFPSLKQAGMTYEDKKYDDIQISDKGYFLEVLKDFQSLTPKSLEAGVPVFALTDEEINLSGAALKTQTENRTLFNDLYSTIVDKILYLTK